MTRVNAERDKNRAVELRKMVHVAFSVSGIRFKDFNALFFYGLKLRIDAHSKIAVLAG